VITIIDWIFEGTANWLASIVSSLMDSVSGIFLNTLNTDMTVMEQYFPFAGKAFEVFQYTAWALIFLITVWQLFRSFGGPITEAENPWHLLARGTIFAVMVGYAKPIFTLALDIARAPYTALMDTNMIASDFTFAGVENVLKSGLVTLIGNFATVGTILLLILLISLGWNYFKLLLEVVERYIVVGVLLYTSPLAYAMGGSKTTNQVFKSWCRMVGSQLLLLVMNVWFLRGFSSSVGYFTANGGALSNGEGNIFLWMFCALAFLKTAQKFDSYLGSIGLNVAQTGGSMGMEMLMAARVIGGFGGGPKSVGSIFRGASSAGGAATSSFGGAAGGFLSGFTSRFKPNSFVRDAVTEGGTKMGAGGGIGFVGRAFGGMAARGGAVLNGDSIASVASRSPQFSGRIGGDIADRSLQNFMPHLLGQSLSNTQISGGQISTTATTPGGKQANVELFNASQFNKPNMPHATVNASDGSQWYQIASGDGAGEFYQTPQFTGDPSESAQVASAFPGVQDGTSLRTVDDGTLEATYADGSTGMWYNSGHFEEPDAPHETISGADGVSWYGMTPHAETPQFESGDDAADYNNAQFQSFIPGYSQQISQVNADRADDGRIEVRHADGSGTMFYDQSQFAVPRGEHQTYEDSRGGQWYGISGTPSVEHRPVYEEGKPVYENGSLKTTKVESVRYSSTPSRFSEPQRRNSNDYRPPKRKQ